MATLKGLRKGLILTHWDEILQRNEEDCEGYTAESLPAFYRKHLNLPESISIFPLELGQSLFNHYGSLFDGMAILIGEKSVLVKDLQQKIQEETFLAENTLLVQDRCYSD